MEGVPVPVCRVCLKQQESPLKDITGTIRSEFEKLKKRLIPGMLHLNEAWLSAALVKEMEDAGAGTRLSDYRELRFDEEGTAGALR